MKLNDKADKKSYDKLAPEIIYVWTFLSGLESKTSSTTEFSSTFTGFWSDSGRMRTNCCFVGKLMRNTKTKKKIAKCN